jgi:hypothetical protein
MYEQARWKEIRSQNELEKATRWECSKALKLVCRRWEPWNELERTMAEEKDEEFPTVLASA